MVHPSWNWMWFGYVTWSHHALLSGWLVVGWNHSSFELMDFLSGNFSICVKHQIKSWTSIQKPLNPKLVLLDFLKVLIPPNQGKEGRIKVFWNGYCTLISRYMRRRLDIWLSPSGWLVGGIPLHRLHAEIGLNSKETTLNFNLVLVLS